MIAKIKSSVDISLIIYVAVSVSTFWHSAWGASVIFSGFPVEPVQFDWYLQGILTAIAIDVGLVFSAGKLAKQWSIWTLLAFIVSAASSVFFQTFYVAQHAPPLSLSLGVSEYWVAVISPILEARIVLVPLMLPLIAVLYALSHSSKRELPRDTQSPQMVDDTGTLPRVSLRVTREPSDGLLRAIEDIKQGELPEGEVTEVAGYLVDLESNAFYDQARGRAYGPYKTRAAMLGAMKQAARRPRLPSGGG